MTTRNDATPKIGEGHASAMLRLGLKELRAAAVLSPDSNIVQPAEYGLYGTKTPGEVAESRRAEGLDLEEEKHSVLADRMRQADARDDHGTDSREMEK
jgi:hypothetical protein